jgi:Tol biopolymer transport system component
MRATWRTRLLRDAGRNHGRSWHACVYDRRLRGVSGSLSVRAAGSKVRNGKIAFWSDLGPAGIFVINPDGSGRRRLTDVSARAKGAAWSPNGRRIALYGSADSGGDANFDIYVMNADGTGRTRLTNSPAREVQPAWSPDGRRIAYGRDDDVWIMEGRRQRTTPRGPERS